MSGLDCREALLLIDAAIDGETDAADRAALEAHAAACPDCARVLAERQALSRRIRETATRHATPEAFRSRLLAALPPEEPVAKSVEARSPPSRRPDSGRLGWTHWLSWGGAAVTFAAGLALFLAAPPPPDTLTRDLLGAHLRSLMGAHITDVESSDRHTVKPWFNGRIDFSPPVPDLAGDGFPLIGGRLDYVDEHPAAALVYRRRQHILNLFVWTEPGGGASGAAPVSKRNGYAILRWHQGNLACALVSDLNPKELEEFRRLWTNRADAANPGMPDGNRGYGPPHSVPAPLEPGKALSR